ncbi:MAG: hypothetical protein ACTHU1_14165 [Arachnia sp.]
MVGSLASVAVAAAAGALATVATGGAALPVALVAGGIAGGGEAAIRGFDALVNRFNRDPETRALLKAIENAVSASVRKFSPEPAEQGEQLAADIVRTRGLSLDPPIC